MKPVTGWPGHLNDIMIKQSLISPALTLDNSRAAMDKTNKRLVLTRKRCKQNVRACGCPDITNRR